MLKHFTITIIQRNFSRLCWSSWPATGKGHWHRHVLRWQRTVEPKFVTLVHALSYVRIKSVCIQNSSSLSTLQALLFFGLPLTQKLALITVHVDTATVLKTTTAGEKTERFIAEQHVGRPVTNKEQLLNCYPECFSGIGQLPGTYHISLDPSVPPVVHSPRCVPIALRDDIKHELNNIEQDGIIQKMIEGQPTEWVNNLVYQCKSTGKLRICLDPKDLNKFIKR